MKNSMPNGNRSAQIPSLYSRAFRTGGQLDRFKAHVDVFKDDMFLNGFLGCVGTV